MSTRGCVNAQKSTTIGRLDAQKSSTRGRLSAQSSLEKTSGGVELSLYLRVVLQNCQEKMS